MHDAPWSPISPASHWRGAAELDALALSFVQLAVSKSQDAPCAFSDAKMFRQQSRASSMARTSD
jgi:hypothetical protein